MKVIPATKQPVTITAVLWDGSHSEAGAIIDWIRDLDGIAEFKETNETVHKKHPEIRIHTLEGKMAVSPGDWVIKGIKGELYPCKPDIFDATYNYIKPLTTTSTN